MRIYNETMNPEIWDEGGEKIKSCIRIRLLQVANDFYKQTGLKVPISDVLLLGSNANYNYTKTSDLDVHVVIDFSKLDMSPEDAKKYTNLLKMQWNKDHDIALHDNNLELLKNILKDINDYRNAGLDRAGEFSTENIVFKLLRSKGYIDRVREAINKVYDTSLSIN